MGTRIKELFDLTGRVALITGGAGMLGREHADAIAEAGGIPVLIGLEDEECKSVAKALEQTWGVKAMGMKANITDPEEVGEAISRTLDAFGRIDILINNASLTVKSGAERLEGYFAPFEEYPLELWKMALDVNLTGMFLVTQAVGRVMVEQERGAVLNIASTAGNVGPDHRIYEGIVDPYTRKPFNTPISYSTTKAGVINFTRYLATYWGDKQIRVNCLSPGGVYDGHPEDFVHSYSYRVPMGRMADRSEYKGAVLFLVSDASSYMTGANVIVDGGWTAW